MRIANIMLGKGLGGIERAFLDYSEGLRALGHDVTAITHPLAKVNAALAQLPLSHTTLPNRGKWDWKTPERLRTILNTLRTDLVIVHGGRATLFATRAAKGKFPIVAVAHNYHFRAIERVDFVFAITEHMKEAIIAKGLVAAEKVAVMPNSIETHGGFIRPVWKQPPTIGALGRMVEKKDFALLLDALFLLKQRGYALRAVIAGNGPEERSLIRKARKLGLHEVSFPGWVADAATFLRGIDIFCLPSRHEPFGIVLLEAMAAKLPVASTASEGPSQILTHGVDGLLSPCGDAEAMANSLAHLLDDEDRARRMASDAYHHVKRRYGRERVMAEMETQLRSLVDGFPLPEPEPAARLSA